MTQDAALDCVTDRAGHRDIYTVRVTQESVQTPGADVGVGPKDQRDPRVTWSGGRYLVAYWRRAPRVPTQWHSCTPAGPIDNVAAVQLNHDGSTNLQSGFIAGADVYGTNAVAPGRSGGFAIVFEDLPSAGTRPVQFRTVSPKVAKKLGPGRRHWNVCSVEWWCFPFGTGRSPLIGSSGVSEEVCGAGSAGRCRRGARRTRDALDELGSLALDAVHDTELTDSVLRVQELRGALEAAEARLLGEWDNRRVWRLRRGEERRRRGSPPVSTSPWPRRAGGCATPGRCDGSRPSATTGPVVRSTAATSPP